MLRLKATTLFYCIRRLVLWTTGWFETSKIKWVYAKTTLVLLLGSEMLWTTSADITPSAAHATIASCRGLATEVVKAMTYLTEKDEQVYSYSDIVLIGTGVAEFAVFGNDVEDIIQRFPNLKVAVFAEESSSKKVYVGYSECGANGITVSQVAGSYKDNDTRRWSKMHAPSEKSFTVNNSDIAKYEFPYMDEWKRMNFLYSYAGKTMILGGK